MSRKPEGDREHSFALPDPSCRTTPTRLPNWVTCFSRGGAWMAPRSATNKAKAAGFGASSFLDLKAEVASKEKEITENRAAGKKTTSSGRKPGKVSGPSPSHPSHDSGRSCLCVFLVWWSRRRPYGADLIRASTRGPRGILSSRPSNGRRSKPRTRFWNESQEYTRNLTKEWTPGYQKSNMGHCLSTFVRETMNLLVDALADQPLSGSSIESRWMTNLLKRRTWMKA